ncbi:MAG: hypothetical protein J0L53_11275 [Spirochaetes bacterium]|nr:hypothetical protein [Spirochaetota bacterium]
MLRRIFGNIIPSIDRAIERIPPHIRDIIQKASLAFAALCALLAIIAGINKGLQDAKPVGFKLVERNRDIFYLQEMREEYAKKRKLVEDVEVDPLDFPSRQKAQDETKFAAMGRDTMGHLMGEKEEMLKHEDVLRPKEKSPGYLGDSYQIPRIAPDKKAIEDDDAHLTKEKIGSVKKEAAPAIVPAVPAMEKTAPPKPMIPQATKGRDIFDESDAPRAKPAVAEKPAAATKTAKGKMEFIE